MLGIDLGDRDKIIVIKEINLYSKRRGGGLGPLIYRDRITELLYESIFKFLKRTKRLSWREGIEIRVFFSPDRRKFCPGRLFIQVDWTIIVPLVHFRSLSLYPFLLLHLLLSVIFWNDRMSLQLASTLLYKPTC